MSLGVCWAPELRSGFQPTIHATEERRSGGKRFLGQNRVDTLVMVALGRTEEGCTPDVRLSLSFVAI